MPDTVNLDPLKTVIDAIENAVFAYPDSPSRTRSAMQLDHANRSRVVGQTAQCNVDSIKNCGR